MTTAAPTRVYYKRNRLKQLRAFCHAARNNSVTAAAERMHLSQPTVSLLVKSLENELGTRLFERRGPRISLTPEGKILHELAEPLVEGVENLGAVFAERCRNITSGQLDIAAGESTTLYILPPIVREFSLRYPNVRFKLHNVAGGSALDLLRANEVDFAVGPMLEIPDEVDFQPLLAYEPVLITPPDHPLAARTEPTLAQIAAYGLILPPRHMSTWRIVEFVFRQHGVRYTVTLEAQGWEVIKGYVEAGLGVSIVTSVCLRGTERLAVRPLARYFPRRSYGLILRKGKHLSPAARRFIELLGERCNVPEGAVRTGAAGSV